FYGIRLVLGDDDDRNTHGAAPGITNMPAKPKPSRLAIIFTAPVTSASLGSGRDCIRMGQPALFAGFQSRNFTVFFRCQGVKKPYASRQRRLCRYSELDPHAFQNAACELSERP